MYAIFLNSKLVVFYCKVILLMYFLIILQDSQIMRSLWLITFYTLLRFYLWYNTYSIFSIICFGGKNVLFLWLVQSFIEIIVNTYNINTCKIAHMSHHIMFQILCNYPQSFPNLLRSFLHLTQKSDGTFRKWTELLDVWGNWSEAVAASGPTGPLHGCVDRYLSTWVTHLRPTAVGRGGKLSVQSVLIVYLICSSQEAMY